MDVEVPVRRVAQLLVLVVVVFVSAAGYPTGNLQQGDAAPVSAHPSRFAASRLGPVQSPPTPLFARTTHDFTLLDRSGDALDACQGPVAIYLGRGWPVLVAEHDYCGGSAWISQLGRGDAVRLAGDGVDDGLYVVTENRFQLRGKGLVGDLPNADVVLQTCVTKDKIVLVGLTQYRPYPLVRQ